MDIDNIIIHYWVPELSEVVGYKQSEVLEYSNENISELVNHCIMVKCQVMFKIQKPEGVKPFLLAQIDDHNSRQR